MSQEYVSPMMKKRKQRLNEVIQANSNPSSFRNKNETEELSPRRKNGLRISQAKQDSYNGNVSPTINKKEKQSVQMN